MCQFCGGYSTITVYENREYDEPQGVMYRSGSIFAIDRKSGSRVGIIKDFKYCPMCGESIVNRTPLDSYFTASFDDMMIRVVAPSLLKAKAALREILELANLSTSADDWEIKLLF